VPPGLVGEQLAPAPAAALERLDDLADAVVDHALVTPLPALGGIVEDHRAVPADRHVLLAHRREPVRRVLDRVLLGADPEEAALEQPHGGGQDAPAVELRAVPEVPLDLPAQPRERLREADHVAELLQVAPLAPVVVVAVLLAPGGVRPRRLEVAAGVRADPDVLPRGRDRELGDAGERLRLVDPLPVVVDVREAAAAADAPDPGSGAVGAS
jgi:hypothetical protein